MALTQDEWYAKFKSWLPPWFFETEANQKAILMGLAKAFSTIGGDGEANVLETFIAQSDGDYLIAHGAERSITKLSGETDVSLRLRVRNIANKSNIPALKSIVASFAVPGLFYDVVEDFNSTGFCSRGYYCSRPTFLLLDLTYNSFSVVLAKQIPAGQSVPDQLIYDSINRAIDDAKALGVLFRVVELR